MGFFTENGELFVLRPGNPAAGADLFYALPTGYKYSIQAVYLEYVAAAVAGNRNVRLEVQDSVGTIYRAMQIVYQTTGVTIQYCFQETQGYTMTALIAATLVAPGIPRNMILSGYAGGANRNYILTNTLNIQAGDQIKNVCITTMRCPI